MKGFKRCPNRHFYKEELAECPHCAAGAGGATSNMDKTAVGGAQGNNFEKTQIFGQQGDSDETQIVGGNSTQVFGAGKGSNQNKQVDFGRTHIAGVTDNAEEGGQPTKTVRAQRKICGWIVSFTLDDMGVDYRIYEGSNSIGRDPDNTISITTDSTISGNHANILHRSGKFWIEDAMTSNGTCVNGTELEPRKAYEIKDGDELSLGDTKFTFKTWL